jgi:tRNA(fMet)-specific endonuclease VapC
MKLVDTTFLIDLSRKKEAAFKKAKELEEQIVYFSEISRFELVLGSYALGGDVSSRIGMLDDLLKNFEPLSFDKAAAIAAGMIAGELHRKGKPIGPSDCMIAGIALSNNIPAIVTKNKNHFDRIEGIKTETY